MAKQNKNCTVCGELVKNATAEYNTHIECIVKAESVLMGCCDDWHSAQYTKNK